MDKVILATILAFKSLGKEISHDSLRWMINRTHTGAPIKLDEAMEVAWGQSDSYYENKQLYDEEVVIRHKMIADLDEKAIMENHNEAAIEYLKVLNEMNLFEFPENKE